MLVKRGAGMKLGCFLEYHTPSGKVSLVNNASFFPPKYGGSSYQEKRKLNGVCVCVCVCTCECVHFPRNRHEKELRWNAV